MHPFEVLAHPLKSLTDDVFELKAAGEKNVFRMWEMKDESLKSEPDFKDVLYCFFSHYSLFGWVKSSSHLLSVRRCNELFFFPELSHSCSFRINAAQLFSRTGKWISHRRDVVLSWEPVRNTQV